MRIGGHHAVLVSLCVLAATAASTATPAKLAAPGPGPWLLAAEATNITPQRLQIGPLDGWTTVWHDAPLAASLPAGTTLLLRIAVPVGRQLRWRGALDLARVDAFSIAEVKVSGPGEQRVQAVLTAIADQPEAVIGTFLLTGVARSVEREEITSIAVSLAPDGESAPAIAAVESLAQSSSIARLRVLGADHYLTSVRRALAFATLPAEPNITALAEWRVDGVPHGLGATFEHVFEAPPGTHLVSVGPPGRAQTVTIDTYSVTILPHDSSLQVLDGSPLSLVAVTQPPGLSGAVSWAAATKHGRVTPEQAQGAIFEARFEATLGHDSRTGAPEQLRLVRADDALHALPPDVAPSSPADGGSGAAPGGSQPAADPGTGNGPTSTAPRSASPAAGGAEGGGSWSALPAPVGSVVPVPLTLVSGMLGLRLGAHTAGTPNVAPTNFTGIPDSPSLLPHAAVTTQSPIVISGTAILTNTVKVVTATTTLSVPVIDGQFSVAVPLVADIVNKLHFTALSYQGKPSAVLTTTVAYDLQPPQVIIDYPLDQAQITTSTTMVSGRVSDLLSGFMGLTVDVNGVSAQVNPGIGTNGTFFATGVSLGAGGAIALVASAADAMGNASSDQITVTPVVVPPGSPQLLVTSGNAQTALMNTQLPLPIVVTMTQGDGTPFVNKVVTFDVSKSNGLLSADGILPGSQMLQQVTDAAGLAQAFWTLGSDAGFGNNRLEVTSNDILGTTLFCASATPGPAAQINVSSGNEQIAEQGGPATQPLSVWVNDTCNGVAGVPVTFSATLGGGSFGGQTTVTLPTDMTGHVEVDFLLGTELPTQLVEADYLGNTGPPAQFVLHGIARDETLPTTFGGVVLDNANRPIAGASCSLSINNAFAAQLTTDAQGQFFFANIADSGAAVVEVDGLVATMLDGNPIPVGSFPKLAFELVLVPNADNLLPTPVLLPALDPANARNYSTTVDTVLTLDSIAGLALTVTAGSMSIGGVPAPDGTIISLNPVQFDAIPMPLPDGASAPFAWTVQPAGATFDPPIAVSFPNMSGLPPGSVVYLLSFDHAVHDFVIAGTGEVSSDGLSVDSDPGSGLSVAGWSGTCPPYSPPTEVQNCGGTKLTNAAKSLAGLVGCLVKSVFKVSAKIECGLAIVGLVQSTKTAYDAAKADGVIDANDASQLLALVKPLKTTALDCAKALTPAKNPCVLSQKLALLISLLTAGINSTEAGFCLQPGGSLETANDAATLGSNWIAKLNSLCNDLNNKNAALLLACGVLDLILDTLDLIESADSSVDPITILDQAFADLETHSTAATAPDASMQAVIATQAELTTLQTDVDSTVTAMENNTEIAGATVSVATRSTVASPGGGFRVTNIPGNTGLTRINVVSTSGGTTRYGASGFFNVSPNLTLTNASPISLGPTPPPVPVTTDLTIPSSLFTSIGEQGQLTLTAQLSDGTAGDITLRSAGSTYMSSNAAIATVGIDGLVTATGAGSAALTASNQGVTTVSTITVVPGDLLTTVMGFVQRSDGTVVVGADVTIVPGDLTAQTDALGGFSISGVPTQLGLLSLSAVVTETGSVLTGDRADVQPVAGLLTDAGIIVVSDSVFWSFPGSGDWSEASKWSGGIVPDGTKKVVIDRSEGDFTITVSAGAQFIDSLLCNERLTLSGGSLQVTKPFQVNNVFTLSGGTLSNSQLFGDLTATANSNNRLDGVTLNGKLMLTAANARVRFADVTLNGTAHLLGGLSSIGFEGDQTLTSGTISGGSTANVTFLEMVSPGTLTIGPGATLRGGWVQVGSGWHWGQAMTMVNNGTVSADRAGFPLIMTGPSFTNNGAAGALNGGTLSLTASSTVNMGAITATNSTLSFAGGWSNPGTITTSGATVNLGGTFTTAGLGSFVNTASTVNIIGVLDNTGSTLLLDGSTGNWNLAGGTISGGALNMPGAATLVPLANSSNRLDGVTINGDLTLAAWSSRVRFNNVTLNGTAYFLGSLSSIGFEGDQTLTTGTFAFDSTSNICFLEMVSPGTLTIGPGVTMRGGWVNIGGPWHWGAPMTVVNNSTISADRAGFPLSMTGSGFINNTTIEAINGSTLRISAATSTNLGSFTASNSTLTVTGAWTNPGTITASGSTVNLGGTFTTAGIGTFVNTASTVNLTGVMDNSASSLVLDGSTGSWNLNGGTISGGTLDMLSGATLVPLANSNNRLDGVTVNGDLTLAAASARVRFNNVTLNGTVHLLGGLSALGFDGDQTLNSGTIACDSTSNICFLEMASPGTLTIGPGVTLRGGWVNVGGSWHWGAPMAVVNNGTVSADRAGFPLAMMGSGFTNNTTAEVINGGTLNISATAVSNVGTLTATNSTLTVAGGWTNPGTITASGSTVNLGGNYTTAGIGTFTTSTSTVNITGVMDNTASSLVLDGSTGSWNLNGGTISGGTLDLLSGATLAPLANSSNRLDGVIVNGDLTLAAASARVRFNNVTLNGTAHLLGGLSAIGFEGNQTLSTGTIACESISNVCFLEMVSPGTLTIGPGVTLRGGWANVGGIWHWGQPMTVVNNGTVSADRAGLKLEFQSASFTNNATAQALNGGVLSIKSPSWSTAGNVLVDASSTLTTTGAYTQTAGLTTLSGGALTAAGLVDIQIGSGLGGSGTVNGNVSLAGTLSPGASAGTLSINGSYTQLPSADLDVELGGLLPGTQHDRLAVSGAVTLGGALNVSLINGFVPTLGDTFGILTYSGASGAFASTSGLALGGGLILNVNVGATVLSLDASPGL